MIFLFDFRIVFYQIDELPLFDELGFLFGGEFKVDQLTFDECPLTLTPNLPHQNIFIKIIVMDYRHFLG